MFGATTFGWIAPGQDFPIVTTVPPPVPVVVLGGDDLLYQHPFYPHQEAVPPVPTYVPPRVLVYTDNPYGSSTATGTIRSTLQRDEAEELLMAGIL